MTFSSFILIQNDHLDFRERNENLNNINNRIVIEKTFLCLKNVIFMYISIVGYTIQVNHKVI